MQNILDKLNKISKSKNSFNVEKEISLILLNFKDNLPPKLSDQDIIPIETTLLKNGWLSQECAILIGYYLVELYLREKSHRFWNLLELASKTPNSAIIFALSYVIKKLGHNSRSSLQALSNQLCSYKEPLVYPALYALKQLFNVCGDTINKTAMPAFNFAKSYLFSNTEPIQIIAIKVISSLIPLDVIPLKRHLTAIEKLFKSTKTSLSISTAAKHIALLSAFPIIKERLIKYKQNSSNSSNQIENTDEARNDDFRIQAKTRSGERSTDQQKLTSALSILRLFKDQDKPFSLIFKLFLNLLEPDFIAKNFEQLFNFSLTLGPSVLSFFW